jgi:tRNA threonylcarbamoyladenosine biosynthesis protein TsaE
MQTSRKYLPEPDATMRAGAALARGLRAGMIVTLTGELGAGKTTLVRGLVRGLGWTGTVKSPSYTLVEQYLISSLYFYHFDFYRFDSPDEWDAAGFSEYFRADAVCVMEWPERVAERLPTLDLFAHLEHADHGRALTLTASTRAGSACLERFAA